MYPCEPPESHGNSAAASATSQARSHVPTATYSAGSRTTASPVTPATRIETTTGDSERSHRRPARARRERRGRERADAHERALAK